MRRLFTGPSGFVEEQLRPNPDTKLCLEQIRNVLIELAEDIETEQRIRNDGHTEYRHYGILEAPEPEEFDPGPVG